MVTIENTFTTEGPGFEFLEYFKDGQWYRLEHTQDNVPDDPLVFSVGNGKSLGLMATFVQKEHFYGTRLEPRLYRLTLEMTKNNEDTHYLAHEFQIQ